MENILLNKFSPYDYDKCSLVLKLIKDSKIPYNATIDVDKVVFSYNFSVVLKYISLVY